MKPCTWCGEPVPTEQQHETFMEPMHYVCGVRMTLGSVAHIERRCSCYVSGSTEGDPPNLTKHEAANKAFYAMMRNVLERVKP